MLSPNLRAITLRICVSGISVCPSSPLFVNAATVATGFAVAIVASAPGLNPSTSFLVIRPPSPLPFIFPISMPFSSAIFLARGDAFILVSVFSVFTSATGSVEVAAAAVSAEAFAVDSTFELVADALLLPAFSAAT